MQNFTEIVLGNPSVGG